MKISVIIPTIEGREDSLEQTLATYRNSLDASRLEFVIVRDELSCGDAWNVGAKLATGELLHFGADDLEPARPDWWIDAAAAIGDGFLPVGSIVEHSLDGETRWFGGDFARVPFIHRDWWRAMPAGMHYFTDNLLTQRAAEDDHAMRFCESFAFTHRPVRVGRLDTPERFSRDRAVFLTAN